MTAVAFKMPEGPWALTWTRGDASFERRDIDEWLARQLQSHGWTGWFCYGGLCKGIVLWNATCAAWLVHTVPLWPCKTPLEVLPESERVRGHSFAWWCGNVAVLRKIESRVVRV